MLYNPHLQMFLSVADSGSFSKAAEKNFISVSAVIKQINLLERNLQVRLFERTNHGLFLTEAGHVLYNNAEKIIHLCDEVEQITSEAQENAGTIIRIGSSDMTPASALASFLPGIHDLDPEIQFKIINFSNSEKGDGFLFNHISRGIDIVAAAYAEDLLEAIQCKALELYQEPFCISVPDYHPLNKKESLTLSDLHGETLLLQNPQFMRISGEIYKCIQSSHPQIRIRFFDAYDFTLFEQAYSRNHLLLSIPSWEKVHPFHSQKQIDWEFKTSVGILYAETSNRKIVHFLDLMKQILTA